MDIIRNAVAGTVPAIGNACLRVEGMSGSVRIVSNPLSTVVVVAAPVAATREVLAALGSSQGEAFVYGLTGSRPGAFGLIELAARIGSTERPPAGRLLRHLARPPIPAAETFFVVAGRTAGILTPDLARALEGELARQAGAANRYAIVGSYSFPVLTAASRLVVDHWIGQLRYMLADAGIPLLMERENDPPPAGAVREILKTGYSLAIRSGLQDEPGSTRWELKSGAVHVRAICSDRTVVIEAGSRGRATPVPSHQLCLKRKFDELRSRRILLPVPGRRDQVEAMRPFQVPSLLNGARLFHGTNVSGQGWRRIA